MAIWNVTTGNGRIGFGGKSRAMPGSSGCNEPFKGSYWCPGRKWFSKEPCPFSSKSECANYRRLCGSI